MSTLAAPDASIQPRHRVQLVARDGSVAHTGHVMLFEATGQRPPAVRVNGVIYVETPGRVFGGGSIDITHVYRAVAACVFVAEAAP